RIPPPHITAPIQPPPLGPRRAGTRAASSSTTTPQTLTLVLERAKGLEPSTCSLGSRMAGAVSLGFYVLPWSFAYLRGHPKRTAPEGPPPEAADRRRGGAACTSMRGSVWSRSGAGSGSEPSPSAERSAGPASRSVGADPSSPRKPTAACTSLGARSSAAAPGPLTACTSDTAPAASGS